MLKKIPLKALLALLGAQSIATGVGRADANPVFQTWSQGFDQCGLPAVFVRPGANGAADLSRLFVVPETLHLKRDASGRANLRIHAYRQAGLDYIALAFETQMGASPTELACLKHALPGSSLQVLAPATGTLGWMPAPSGLGAQVQGDGAVGVVGGDKWVSVLLARKNLFAEFRFSPPHGLFGTIMTGALFYTIELGGTEMRLSAPVSLDAEDDLTLSRFVHWRLYGGPLGDG